MSLISVSKEIKICYHFDADNGNIGLQQVALLKGVKAANSSDVHTALLVLCLGILGLPG